MALYLISYDLKNPGRNYVPVYNLLARLRAQRVLESVWLLESVAGAVAIRDTLAGVADGNDAVVVIELTKAAAWACRGGQKGGIDWLKVHIP